MTPVIHQITTSTLITKELLAHRLSSPPSHASSKPIGSASLSFELPSSRDLATELPTTLVVFGLPFHASAITLHFLSPLLQRLQVFIKHRTQHTDRPHVSQTGIRTPSVWCLPHHSPTPFLPRPSGGIPRGSVENSVVQNSRLGSPPFPGSIDEKDILEYRYNLA